MRGVIGGSSITGNVSSGNKLHCMTEDCVRRGAAWVERDEEAGVDSNGQPHGDRIRNLHVCMDCRDALVTNGWRDKQW